MTVLAGLPALTAPPADPSRRFPNHPLRRRAAEVAVAAALILLAGLGESLLPAPTWHVARGALSLGMVALGVVIAAGVKGHRLMRRRIAEVEDLTARLQAALAAQQVAETANEAKARYLANVSHEIRSPLNAIYGYAQLVEQGAELRPQQAARVIRRCAEHMTSLVESLLDTSRMDGGVLRVRSEIIPLPEFIEQIVLMMRPAASAKGLDFVCELPHRLPDFVRTDQSRLRQALINLIGNAIKFTDAGSVTLAVRYRGQIATFEIRDTGPGIAPADRERIFDPLEARARPGVGLGLPITQAIVQILGGNLELVSEPGAGACFRITLMLAEPAGALVPEAPHRRIIGHEGPARSILVVDDDADQRGFLERFLTGCGFAVATAADGESAVALCAMRAFDLAVLDISLPGISGWETAVRIREKLGQEMVIIMASANAHEFHRPDFDRPAHDHFLVKPFRLEALTEALGAQLNLTWKWEATGGRSEGPSAGPVRLPAAATEHVEQLQERIEIGHVRGIEAGIGLLAQTAPEHGELVDALYAALDDFDLPKMSSLLAAA